MQRGFEIVEKYQDAALNLPKRATKQAAGYDFEAAQDMLLPSIWKLGVMKVFYALWKQHKITEAELSQAEKIFKPYLVPTGIKAYMQENEYLLLANRSSNPLKKGLVLPNGVGVVDADYYNNSANEGEIFFQLVNFGVRDVTIKKGERIGQGIFSPFLRADNETEASAKRTGGFGSSGRH